MAQTGEDLALTRKALLQIAATLYLFKVAYEVAATPLTYTIVRWLKRVEGVEVFDRTTDFSPFRL